MMMKRRLCLAEKIDDLYATILRQSFFTIFEMDAHEQIGEWYYSRRNIKNISSKI